MKLTVAAIILPLMLLGAGCARDKSQTVPSTAGSTQTDAVEESGAVVDLSGQGLREVPDDILRRGDVTSLDLSDNELDGALPAEIRHMRSLEVLDASGNLMTGVPAEIGQLSELRILDLSDNQLTGLPYELGNLQNLELLDLSGNAYSETDLSIIEEALPDTTVIRR